MRLTLRTLLAYLDDTLDSSQVKKIGQKVAESDTAQELIARIKQVTRRRRLTVPPEKGAGNKLDENKIAEYLDNLLSEDDVAELEQICLGSDVRLAELAACHQILTLVLGEPILIPPTSQRRMYGLVKGPEAVPTRKPPEEQDETQERDELYETDEALRMGLPALRGTSWTSRFVLIIAGIAACALLIFAITQALRVPGIGGNGKQFTETPKDKKQPGGEDKDKNKIIKPPKKDGAEKVIAKDKKIKSKDGKLKKDNGKPKDKVVKNKPPIVPDIPIKPPSDEVRETGSYRLAGAGRGLLMQRDPKLKKWQQVNVMQPVNTGSRLVSLPGFQSVVDTQKGLRLTLWGLQPEQVFFYNPFLLECVAQLHHHDVLDLDMHLYRGRIAISNQSAKPARIRIRFDNPTNPHLPGTWDVILKEPGTQIMVERWTQFPPFEPFFKDPTHNDRKGPYAQAHMLVVKGKATLLDRKKPYEMTAPPGAAYIYWDSFRGTVPPKQTEKLPDWVDGEGKLSEKLDAKQRKNRIAIKNKMLETTGDLAKKLASSSADVALTSYVQSKNGYEVLLALRSFAALDDIRALVDALDDEDSKRGGVRRETVNILKRWLSCERDNAYRLYDVLDDKYSKLETDEILSLLHSFSRTDIGDVRTYKTLVHRLNSPKIAIRELAGRQLMYDLQQYFEKPVGLEIAYDPGAPAEVREAAQRAWMKLIDEGKVPPKEKAPLK